MDKTALIDALSNLSVMEMAELKTSLEEKWGVSAAAPVAAMAAPQAAAAPAAESTEFEVTLTSVPADKKISAIKVVRELTGLGLKEAKELVEGAPKVVKERAGKAEADQMAQKIKDAGSEVAIKGL